MIFWLHTKAVRCFQPNKQGAQGHLPLGFASARGPGGVKAQSRSRKTRALPWTRCGLRSQTPESAARLFLTYAAKPVPGLVLGFAVP